MVEIQNHRYIIQIRHADVYELIYRYEIYKARGEELSVVAGDFLGTEDNIGFTKGWQSGDRPCSVLLYPQSEQCGNHLHFSIYDKLRQQDVAAEFYRALMIVGGVK